MGCQHGIAPPQAQLEALLAALRGACPVLRIVLTCRLRSLLPPAMQSCKLQRLPLLDAVDVLRQACPSRQLADAEAEAVSEACGMNALELRLVGGALNRRACDPQVCWRTAAWVLHVHATRGCCSHAPKMHSSLSFLVCAV